MKKLIWILLIIPFAISCNKKKIEQLELKNDSLVQQANFKDQSITEFLTAFNDIQDNLDSIKVKEMIITETTKGKTELKKKAKNQINDDINTIYQLLIDNKEKLAGLRKKLGKANYQVQELEKMVAHLTKQLEAKDIEIETLRFDLEHLNIKVTKLTKDVGDLKEQNKEKAAVIKDQTDEIKTKTIELNTAFYAVGTKKELKENNVITKEGGFVGIGANKKLKQDFSEDFFTKIDIRIIKEILIPGKKIKIVTNHPTESYKISGEDENRILEILDSDKFWKSSKHLVIITD